MDSTPTRNCRTRSFKEQYERLPDKIKRLAVAAFKQFCVDPSHPALRHHKLENRKKTQHKDDSFSVTVCITYRAIYFVDGDTNVWYWIGTHNDYNIFVGQK